MASILSICQVRFPLLEAEAMPKPRLSRPDAVRRRFVVVQLALLAAFAASMVAAATLVPSMASAPLRWLLAAAPSLLLALWAWEFFKAIRDDDEMMRTIHLRAVAISGGLVLLGATMWGILERLLAVPNLPNFLLLPLFAALYGPVSAIVARRG